MKYSSKTILLAVALLAVGYLGGTIATNSGSQDAQASPLWDAAKGAYVTGDATSLTFWKVKDGKVEQAMTFETNGGRIVEKTHKNGMPAAAKEQPAGSGDGKSCGSCGGGGSCG